MTRDKVRPVLQSAAVFLTAWEHHAPQQVRDPKFGSGTRNSGPGPEILVRDPKLWSGTRNSGPGPETRVRDPKFGSSRVRDSKVGSGTRISGPGPEFRVRDPKLGSGTRISGPVERQRSTVFLSPTSYGRYQRFRSQRVSSRSKRHLFESCAE